MEQYTNLGLAQSPSNINFSYKEVRISWLSVDASLVARSFYRRLAFMAR